MSSLLCKIETLASDKNELKPYPKKLMRNHTNFELMKEYATEMNNSQKSPHLRLFKGSRDFAQKVRKADTVTLSKDSLSKLHQHLDSVLKHDKPKDRKKAARKLYKDPEHRARYNSIVSGIKNKHAIPYPTFVRTHEGLHFVGGMHRMVAAAARGYSLPVSLVDLRDRTKKA